MFIGLALAEYIHDNYGKETLRKFLQNYEVITSTDAIKYINEIFKEDMDNTIKLENSEDKYTGTPNDISIEEEGLAKIIEMYENYEKLEGAEKEAADKQIENDKKLFVLNQYVKQLEKNTKLSARNIRRARDKKAKQLGLIKVNG